MAESKVMIRDYREEDWPQVCRVHDAARLQELAAGSVDPRAFRPMMEVAEGEEFFVSRTLVAGLGQNVVGFVSWNGSYITWLYVDPRQQRQGIGRQLLTAALEQIGSEAWTTMIAGNQAALGLYQSVGLEIVRSFPSEIEGIPCEGVRLALPTSRMHDPNSRREKASADSELSGQHATEKERLAELIRSAFQGVMLGNGIGLWEAQAIDDYADDRTLQAARLRDERIDWSRILPSDLDYCYSSLSFFDAAGMRFHLPAFLLAELSGTYTQDLVLKLTGLSNYARSQFLLLSPEQRHVVCAFLIFRLNDPAYVINAKSIRHALDTYWQPPVG